jgi:hypothetical protein
MGLLLLPFTLIDWRLVFVVNPVLLVVGFLFFRRLLEDLELRPGWAFLYLLYPPLVLFSRTVMTEVPSTLATVIALVAYGRGRRGQAAAGLILGLSLFLRYANGIVFLGLLLGALAHDLGRRRDPAAPWLILGFLPGALLFGLYSVIAYGQLSTPGYASAGGGVFGISYVPQHLIFYAIDLVILYPLMLVAPVLYRGPLRWEILAIAATTMLVMSSYYYLDDAHGFVENLLVGARLMLPALPAFLIAYVALLQRLSLPDVAAPTAAGALLVMAAILALVHQRHLEDAAMIRNTIASNTCRAAYVNGEATKFLSPAWGSRNFTVIDPSRVPDTTPTDVVYADTDDRGLDAASHLAETLGDRLAVDLRKEWHVVVWTSCT